MTKERRDAINAAVRRADVTVAEFIWDACQAKIKDDRMPIGTPAASSGTALARHPGSSLAPASEASHGQTAPVDDLAKMTDLALRLSADRCAKEAEQGSAGRPEGCYRAAGRDRGVGPEEGSGSAGRQ